MARAICFMAGSTFSYFLRVIQNIAPGEMHEEVSEVIFMVKMLSDTNDDMIDFRV